MAELGCSVSNCVYNEEKRCCKGDIMVGGRKAYCEEDTCCDSFVDRKQQNSVSNSTQKPHDRISIDCEAENCKYNHNLRCVAEHVDIKGNGAKTSSGTLCATFVEASNHN